MGVSKNPLGEELEQDSDEGENTKLATEGVEQPADSGLPTEEASGAPADDAPDSDVLGTSPRSEGVQ